MLTWGLGFRVREGLGFRVQEGLGFKVKRIGRKVQALLGS